MSSLSFIVSIRNIIITLSKIVKSRSSQLSRVNSTMPRPQKAQTYFGCTNIVFGSLRESYDVFKIDTGVPVEQASWS